MRLSYAQKGKRVNTYLLHSNRQDAYTAYVKNTETKEIGLGDAIGSSKGDSVFLKLSNTQGANKTFEKLRTLFQMDGIGFYPSLYSAGY